MDPYSLQGEGYHVWHRIWTVLGEGLLKVWTLHNCHAMRLVLRAAHASFCTLVLTACTVMTDSCQLHISEPFAGSRQAAGHSHTSLP